MSLKFQQFLQQWFQTTSGRSLLKQEQQLVDRALSHLFGFYLVQLGAVYPSPHSFLERSRTQNKILLDEEQTVYPQLLFIKGDLDYLPFQEESIDVVFMPHTLETVEDPYHLLRQVDRILVPEGHVVITGFNPLGCAILKQRLVKRDVNFKNAHIMKMDRVVDWLNLLSYEIEIAEYSQVTCFGWGEKGEESLSFKIMENLELGLDKVGLNLGNLYCVVGRKRVESPKPVGLNWRLANWLPVNKGVAVNSTRTQEQRYDRSK